MSRFSQEEGLASVIKGLIMDATRKADSGHPGGPMSSTDFALVLFKDILRFDPDDPCWQNRDRFVLSAGHESALLYSLLTLAGFLNLDDLRAFRQLGSRTPGHPEHGVTPGVEATTGPLGQGLAMAVGMAAAERFLSAKFGEQAVDHHTYVLASDGDMQEPVSTGAAALAGKWRLGKLIVFYDRNAIQLSGPISRADDTDYARLFSAMSWHVREIDGHDRQDIRQAILSARQERERPSLIIGRTIIAKGSATREGDFEAHGAPFSREEIRATKQKLGLPEAEEFFLPREAVDAFQNRFPQLRKHAADWRKRFEDLRHKPDFESAWNTAFAERSTLSLTLPRFEPGSSMATRAAWGLCLDSFAQQLPFLVGGSADLDPSNMTVRFREEFGIFGPTRPEGRNMSFGVREFPMTAIANGMALHGGLIPFCATFLVFSDYARNAVRMSALQKLPVLHVYTHDSFALGEDGPTHQPVEHVSSLRLIPDLLVFRPADANETARCLEVALRRPDRPSALCLTRQGLPVLEPGQVVEADRGAYVLREGGEAPDLLLIATGSEVSLALAAADLLPEKHVRVVSMPCMELFLEQDQKYQDAVLPPGIHRRVALEAGRSGLWYRFVGRCGLIIALDHFGDSAPADVLAAEYGFTPQAVAKAIAAHPFQRSIA